MADVIIFQRFWQRRDTAANWTSVNPTLAAGEFGYETDTGKLKIGDGTTVWNSLGYMPTSSAVPDGDYGDITVSLSGSAWAVDANAITYAKMQDVSATKRVLGRNTAGAGDPEEVTLSQLLDWVGSPANGDILFRSGGSWTRLPAGTNGHVLTLASGLPSWAAAPGGSVAGSNKQIQYNNGGAFGAEAGFEYDQTTNTLTVSNITASGLVLTAVSTTSGAGFNIPHGVAPTSPANGDVWTTTSGIYVRINGATVGPLSAGGGGGSLTNWTEGVSTSAPNATVPVVSLAATNAATNVDAAIKPKGSGGIAAHVADGTSTGGNKRGTNHVDWQTNRSNAARVASGTSSTIGGGKENTASGNNSTVAGGDSNTASGFNSSVLGGSNNSATSSGSSVAGGDSNQATAQSSHVTGGASNIADALYARAGGGMATTRTAVGADAFACGLFAVVGDAQRRAFVLRSDTTNATPEAMTGNNSAAATTNQIILPNTSTFTVTGTIVARTSGGLSRSWKVEAHLDRGANAASTTLTAGGTPTIIATNGAFTGTVALTADTTNGGLAVTVTGMAATNIKWVASLETAEVVG